jgi:hypothetical protein
MKKILFLLFVVLLVVSCANEEKATSSLHEIELSTSSKNSLLNKINHTYPQVQDIKAFSTRNEHRVYQCFYGFENESFFIAYGVKIPEVVSIEPFTNSTVFATTTDNKIYLVDIQQPRSVLWSRLGNFNMFEKVNDSIYRVTDIVPMQKNETKYVNISSFTSSKIYSHSDMVELSERYHVFLNKIDYTGSTEVYIYDIKKDALNINFVENIYLVEPVTGNIFLSMNKHGSKFHIVTEDSTYYSERLHFQWSQGMINGKLRCISKYGSYSWYDPESNTFSPWVFK